MAARLVCTYNTYIIVYCILWLGYSQSDHVHFMIDAIRAYAYALHDVHQDLCGADVHVCDDMAPANLSGTLLNRYVRNINFTGMSI